jgi:hypothetical protein
MLLFSRVVTLTGSPRRAVPWATEITEYVNAHSSLDVSLWSCTFGYPVGTFVWSAVVESQVALADGTAQLVTDDGYFNLLEQAEDLVTEPAQDLLREFVHGGRETGVEPPPVGAVATVTTAVALVDRMSDAVGWGIEIGDYVAGITAAPVSVLTNVFGQMGEITWIGVQPDLQAAESAGGKLVADASYLGRLVATKDLFMPASGRTAQVIRVA